MELNLFDFMPNPSVEYNLINKVLMNAELLERKYTLENLEKLLDEVNEYQNRTLGQTILYADKN